MRARKPSCPACGDPDQRIGAVRDIDYVQFCGGARPDWESRGMEGDSERRAYVKVPFPPSVVFGSCTHILSSWL